jgi:hypothetical protein
MPDYRIIFDGPSAFKEASIEGTPIKREAARTSSLSASSFLLTARLPRSFSSSAFLPMMLRRH